MKSLRSFSRRSPTRTISFRIFIVFTLLLAILVAFLSITLYQYSVDGLEELSITNTETLLYEVNYNISNYIDNMKSMGQVVVENSDVRLLLSFYNQHRGKGLTVFQEETLGQLQLRASEHMDVVANTRPDITNIAIISKYDDIVLSGLAKEVNPYSSYRMSDWFLQPLAHWNQIYVSTPHVQNLVKGEYPWVISISETVTDPYTGDVTGVMVIDIEYSAISALVKQVQLGKESYIYLADDKGDIITHPKQQLLYSGIKTEPLEEILLLPSDTSLQRGDIIYLKNKSNITGWNAIGVVDTQGLLINRQQITIYFIFLSVFVLLFAILVAYIISTAVTSPIKELQKSVNQVRDGDLSARSTIRTTDEIGELSDSFNIMVSQIQRLLEEQILIEQSKKQSEIRALQAQINPHFLYNTLDTIIWMSAIGKNEEVMELTEALAHLFRTSISQADSMIPVATEVENIENYLIIQLARYKDKLRYQVEMDPDVEGYFTPALVLQPLVENAIYHGIKTAPKGGEIMVRIFTEEDNLIYEVKDTGVGMTPEQLENIFEEKTAREGTGLGILNVQNRIQLLFGAEYGLTFHSILGKGTKVTLTIPLLTEATL